MYSIQARNAYRQSEAQTKIHPVKLIHLMYERALVHLEMAEEGIKQNSPQMRGENLSKAIAIIAELNASVEEDDDSEAANFLRGLYGAILEELPKVALNDDAKILQQTRSYIDKLKEIWEQTAMVEAGLDVSTEATKNFEPVKNTAAVYGKSVKNVAAVGGVSVSI